MTDHTDRFGYSFSDDGLFNGNLETREAAIEEAVDELIDVRSGELVTIWTGQYAPPSICYEAAAECALEQISETLHDECGEAAENFAYMDKALIAAVAKAIRTTIEEHGGLECWTVVNVQETDITIPERAASQTSARPLPPGGLCPKRCAAYPDCACGDHWREAGAATIAPEGLTT